MMQATQEPTPELTGAPPESVSAAVLVPSNKMPEGSTEVEGLEFNKFAKKEMSVRELVDGMSKMGFQAGGIGEATKIINDMVRYLFLHVVISSVTYKLATHLVP